MLNPSDCHAHSSELCSPHSLPYSPGSILGFERGEGRLARYTSSNGRGLSTRFTSGDRGPCARPDRHRNPRSRHCTGAGHERGTCSPVQQLDGSQAPPRGPASRLRRSPRSLPGTPAPKRWSAMKIAATRHAAEGEPGEAPPCPATFEGAFHGRTPGDFRASACEFLKQVSAAAGRLRPGAGWRDPSRWRRRSATTLLASGPVSEPVQGARVGARLGAESSVLQRWREPVT